MSSNPDIKDIFFRKEIADEGFEIMKLDYFQKEKQVSERFRPHRIKFYLMFFITGGEGQHHIDFKTYNYQKGDLLFVGKNQIQHWGKDNNTTGYLILFTEEFLSENQIKFNDISYSYPYNSSLYKPIVKPRSEDSYNSFSSLIDYLFQEYKLPNSNVKQKILQNLLRTLLLKIQTHSYKEFVDVDKDLKDLFIRFQRMLENKISQTRNANDYCDYLKVSYRKLNEACKVLTNKTIKKFIDDFIILKAKKQLLDSDNNISQTSYLLGFDEVTNFTKFFKKHTNLSPKSFVNSNK